MSEKGRRPQPRTFFRKRCKTENTLLMSEGFFDHIDEVLTWNLYYGWYFMLLRYLLMPARIFLTV